MFSGCFMRYASRGGWNKKEKVMEGIKNILLVLSLIANAGLFAVYVLPSFWKPK